MEEKTTKQCMWIKEAIERRGLDIATVAERMGTTVQNVYYLVREGGTQTKVSSLMALAEAIGMEDIREFFTSPKEMLLRNANDPDGYINILSSEPLHCPHCGHGLKLMMGLR